MLNAFDSLLSMKFCLDRVFTASLAPAIFRIVCCMQKYATFGGYDPSVLGIPFCLVLTLARNSDIN